MMKKTIAILLSLVMILGLAACGNSASQTEQPSTEDTSVESKADTSSAESRTAEFEPESEATQPYDTEETEYSYIMYYAIYNEKSICEYEDYMNLYNTLLSMKCNVDYYIYGIFLLKGAHSKDGVVSVKLNEEKGYKWCAYFFEKLKKMNNITKTRGLYFHIENLEFALGVAYLQGKYVKKDIKKATMCWKSMLKRNVNEYSDIEDAKKVLRCVGGAYIGKSVTVSVDGIKEYEIKVQKNLKLGYKFLEKASEYGDAFSLFCLAEMYEKGEYVKKDFFHAVQLYEQAEENGDDKKKNTLLLFHKYHFFRYFSKRKMNVFIRIKDAISGIERINYAFIPYEEQPIDINKFSQVERTGAEKINDEYFEKEDLSEFSITVSPEKENFKGYLKVYGQDYSGNVSQMVKSKGAISE